MTINEFIKDQDEAFLSLDKQKIVDFMEKYNMHIPKDETVLWAMAHKSILLIDSATPEQRRNSREWLLGHGFSLSFDVGRC